MLRRGPARIPRKVTRHDARRSGEPGPAQRRASAASPRGSMLLMAARRQAPVHDLEREAEAAVVVSWRLNVLVRAGYPQRDALALAGMPHVDLHRAVELLEGGGLGETALRILL